MFLKTSYRNAAGSAVPEEKVITYFSKSHAAEKKKKEGKENLSVPFNIGPSLACWAFFFFLRIKLFFNALL